MTKEELQKWLKNLKTDIGKSQHHELWHYEQAIDIVIEALSDKDINVPNNDCISRQDAIDAIDKIPIRKMQEDGKFLHALVSIAQVWNVLEQLPSQPKVKPRIGRDAYGRLLSDGWHFEVTSAEFGNDGLIAKVGIDALDYRGSSIHQDMVPSAQERKTGRWFPRPEIGWVETWFCSECGEKTTSTVMGKPRYKWCPMCGCRMMGVEHE